MIGAAIGGTIGALLGPVLAVLGATFAFLETFEGGEPNVVGWMVAPVLAAILLGAAIGAGGGYLIGRINARRGSSSTPPPRPDTAG